MFIRMVTRCYFLNFLFNNSLSAGPFFLDIQLPGRLLLKSQCRHLTTGTAQPQTSTGLLRLLHRHGGRTARPTRARMPRLRPTLTSHPAPRLA